MLNLIPLPYRILAGFAVLLVLVGGAYYRGWSSQHDVYIAYKARVAQTASIQAAETAKIDAYHQKELEDATHNTQIATDSISAWYKSHPVRVLLPSACASGVSTASSNTQGADDYAPIEYASPYRPDDTEQVANRLDQLQKLLIKDGVQIEK